MIFLGFSIVGVFALFIVWRMLILIWNKLSGLGIEHAFSSSRLFDTVFYSIIFGLLVGRLLWMIQNVSLFSDVPWAFLPYFHTDDGIIWLSFFPWRFLNIIEGTVYEVSFAIAGISSALLVFFGTFRGIQALKLEKRGIVRNLVVQLVFAVAILFIYFAGISAYIYYLK